MAVRTFKAALPAIIFLIAFSLLLWLAGRIPFLRAHFASFLLGIPPFALAIIYAWNRHSADKQAIETIRTAGIDDKGEPPLRTNLEVINEFRSAVNLHGDTEEGHHARQPERGPHL
jgi:hypothetical protein